MLALKFDTLYEICCDLYELSDCLAWQVCHLLSMSVQCRVQVLSGMSSACGVAARADISESRYLILKCRCEATKIREAL